MTRKSHTSGFSLMELIAVVLLLGVVTAIVLNRLNYVDRKTANENTVTDNTRILQTAVERYRFDFGVFPTNVTALVTDSYIPRAPKVQDVGKAYSIDENGVVDYK